MRGKNKKLLAVVIIAVFCLTVGISELLGRRCPCENRGTNQDHVRCDGTYLNVCYDGFDCSNRTPWTHLWMVEFYSVTMHTLAQTNAGWYTEIDWGSPPYGYTNFSSASCDDFCQQKSVGSLPALARGYERFGDGRMGPTSAWVGVNMEILVYCSFSGLNISFNSQPGVSGSHYWQSCMQPFELGENTCTNIWWGSNQTPTGILGHSGLIHDAYIFGTWPDILHAKLQDVANE